MRTVQQWTTSSDYGNVAAWRQSDIPDQPNPCLSYWMAAT